MIVFHLQACKHAHTQTPEATAVFEIHLQTLLRTDILSFLRALGWEWRPANPGSITVSLQTETSDSSLSVRACSVQTEAPEEKYSMTSHWHAHTVDDYKWYSCFSFNTHSDFFSLSEVCKKDGIKIEIFGFSFMLDFAFHMLCIWMRLQESNSSLLFFLLW